MSPPAAAVPPLSIVMPVRNAMPFLDEAVASIAAQSFGDFEFVIRDDCSTDGSRELLRDWAARDSRIRLFEGAAPLGPAGSSNFVVERARAPVVARMDADDVAEPDRLARQLRALADDPGAVLVGSVWRGIDTRGRIVRPPDFSPLRRGGFTAPFAHGSTMFRRAAFDRIGGYREACDYWEDLDLYVRMGGEGRILVIAEPLYRYRFSGASNRLTAHRLKVEEAVDLMLRCRSLVEDGRDYSPLLAAPPRAGARLHPHAFLSLGFITLWGGGRPPTLWRLLRRSRLGFDLLTLKSLAASAWALAGPVSLRWVLRRLLQRRSDAVLKALGDAPLFEWPIGGFPAAAHDDLPRALRRPAAAEDGRCCCGEGEAAAV